MSTAIYSTKPATKKNNYVYLITNKITNMKYIGSRGTNENIPLNDLKKYKSSTTDKNFKQDQKNNPQNYLYEILSFHSNRLLAIKEESRLHTIYDVKTNTEYYNKSNQTINGFDVSGKIPVYDINKNIIYINCNDPLFISGVYTHINKGMVTVKDIHGNTSQVSIDDPRYLSGELVHINKGRAVVIDIHGNISQVSIDDHDYKSGKLISINKGKITVKDDNGNFIKITTKEYKQGNYVGNTKGRVVVKDIHDNISQVSTDDPLYLSGELVHVNKGRKRNDAFKLKMSNVTSGKNNPFYGKKHSKETLEKVSNVYIINDVKYIGRNEVAKKYDISIRTVLNRCNSDKFPEWKVIK